MTQEADRRAQSEDKAREEHPVGEWPALDFVPTPLTPFVSLLFYENDKENDDLPFPTLDEVPYKNKNEK